MNIFLTDKIYFHFDGENDGGDGWDDEGIGEGDGVCLFGGDDKGREKGGRDLMGSPSVGLGRGGLDWGGVDWGGGLVFSLVGLLWLSQEVVDDLELFWGEDFAGAGVAGGLKGGHEGFVGMDFVSEAFARTLPAMVGEVGHSEVLLVLIHNNEILIKQLAKGRN